MGKLVLSLPPAYALPILVTQVIIPVDPGAPADLTFPRKVFLGNKEVYVALLSLKLSVCLACHIAISILQGTDPFIVQKDGLQFGQAILVRSKHWNSIISWPNIHSLSIKVPRKLKKIH